MMQLEMRNLMTGAVGAAAVTVLLGSASVASAQSAPTFTKDVAPIFQAKCEACHRPDSIAPMSLQTWQQARPWARSIKARVSEHSMPPFQIDRTVGVTKFKNDDSLSPAELETIVKWATRRTCRPPSPGRPSRAGTSPRCSARPNPT
jgi:hypothetical protein